MVNITFESRPLQRLCNEALAMKARWGVEQAQWVAQSLNEMDAVDTLGDLAALPHVLVEMDSRGITVDSPGSVRIVLRVENEHGRPVKRPMEIREVVVVSVNASQDSGRRRG